MATQLVPPTILIVEDDEVLGQVLAKVLTCEGRIALHVRTAGDALSQVQENRPHLIVVDAGLRDGTALRLADAIRAEDPSLPLILLTTHHLEKSALPSRGARLITKSIDLPELRRTVETALLECESSAGELEAKFG
jgi:DNA-binding response OmpR family regulator